MMLNFKKKVMLLFSASLVLSLGDVALAQCTVEGSLRFSPLRVALRSEPNQNSVPRVYITCPTPTRIIPSTIQPPEWNQFVNLISYRLRDITSGDPLPPENITAVFRARLADPRGNTLRTWRFDMARPNILLESNGDYELRAGERYQVIIDSLRGLITLPFNPAPYHEAGTSNYGNYMSLSTGQPFSVQGEWTSSTPPVPSTCTASAFIVTAPSQIDFKQMDINSIQAGTKFTKPFTITITRRPSQNCKTTTTPWVTFTTANTLINQTDASIPERGLLLRIYREKTKAALNFGTAFSLGAQSGLDAKEEKYEGHIMKAPSAKVTPGTFSITVNYSISYR